MVLTPAQIGEHFRRRRIELNLNQDAIAGVSPATVRKIEKGTEPNPTDRIKANLAIALRWESDAYDIIRAGGAPREYDALDDEAQDLALTALSDEERAEFEELHAWAWTLGEEAFDKIDRYANLLCLVVLHTARPLLRRQFEASLRERGRPTLAADVVAEDREP